MVNVKLKRIKVLHYGFFGGLGGLFAGLLAAIVALVIGSIFQSVSTANNLNVFALSSLFSPNAINLVLWPISYAIVGFVGGLVGGLIINLVLKIIKGFEMDIEEEE